MSPRVMLSIIFFLSIIALILADRQADELFMREMLFSDRGYNSKRTPEQMRETQEQLEGNVNIKKPKPKTTSGSGGFGKAILYGFMTYAALTFLPIDMINGFAFVAAILVAVVALIVGIVSKARISRERVVVRAPMSKKIGTSIFPIIAMIISALMWVINPIHDMYYYITAVIGMVLIGVCVSKLVARHNTLTSRKLPQFNKRGGEEHENDQ
jgi:hypothetical protein